MGAFYLFCPIDTPEPPSLSGECGVTKTGTWGPSGTYQVDFYLKNINNRMIGFDLSGITNTGNSTITMNVIYKRAGVSITAQSYNLGTLSSPTKKYHFLDLGDLRQTETTITLQFVINGGSGGQLNVSVDCEVNVAKRDFCYVPESVDYNDLCFRCSGTTTVYWEQSTGDTKFFFSFGQWYSDPSLQTPSPCGFYRLKDATNNPVIYRFCNSTLTPIKTCDGDDIDCGSGNQKEHTKSGYTNAFPYLLETNTPPPTTLKYSIQKTSITLPDTNHGYIQLVLSYTGTADDVCWTISDPNALPQTIGYLSYSSSTTLPIFNTIGNLTLFKPEKGQTSLTININVNGVSDSKTRKILVRHIVGKQRNYNGSDIVYTKVTSDCPTPIYSYSGGVHPYSAYDSSYSPKCTTTLYSLTPIASWTDIPIVPYNGGTLVYNDPLLTHPAMPWYYGINSKVYKVGVPFKREYATKTIVTAKSSVAKLFGKLIGIVKDPITYDVRIEGPKNWETFTTIAACVNPLIDPGMIRKVFERPSLEQPSIYMYHVGYHNTQKNLSNDEFFTLYDFDKRRHNPITGFEHATTKLTEGYMAGYNSNFAKIWNKLVDVINNPYLLYAVNGVGLAISTYVFIKSISASFIAANGMSASGDLVCPAACAALGPIALAIASALVIAFIVWQLFKIRKQVYDEPCKNFLKVYTEGPYIEEGNSIYDNITLTSQDTGFYCDGAYFYSQPSTNVTNKELSYATKNGGIYFSLLPDNPTYVNDIGRLFFLSYVAGRPIGFFGPQ